MALSRSREAHFSLFLPLQHDAYLVFPAYSVGREGEVVLYSCRTEIDSSLQIGKVWFTTIGGLSSISFE